MSKVEKFARILIKRSIIPGLSATTGIGDHTELPEWSTSDIYVGEFFLNEIDEKVWLRVNDTTIKRILFHGDITEYSGSTSGTNGTSGSSGTSGTNGTSGSSGLLPGIGNNYDFLYRDSGSSYGYNTSTGLSWSTTNQKVIISNLDVRGALVITGDTTSYGYINSLKVGVFASLASATTTLIETGSTFVPINGIFNNSPMEQFVLVITGVTAPAIKYIGTYTQYFHILWSATLSSDQNGNTVHFGIKKNSSIVSSSIMCNYLKIAGEQYHVSGVCVVELATNDEIQLVVEDNSPSTLTINHYTTSIRRFFN